MRISLLWLAAAWLVPLQAADRLVGLPGAESAGSAGDAAGRAGGAPVCIEAGRLGLLSADVDLAACESEPLQCIDFPAEGAAASNANPVRLVLQLRTPEPLDGLGPEAFSIETQFAPADGATVEPLDCPDCFESLPGGSYAFWLVPDGEHWQPGSYWLLVTLDDGGRVLPALARIDIAGTPPSDALPSAAVVALPPGAQLAERPVVFDGSNSFDPDGDPLTCFQWRIQSSLGSEEIVQGRTASAIQRVFDEEQFLSVTLRVSDRPSAGAGCGENDPPVPGNLLSPNVAVLLYAIECNNPPPFADAGPDIVQNIASAQLIRLDGSGSFDNETPIERFLWSCGNGSVPLPSGSAPVVFCRYTAVGVYSASLTVWDQGTGRIDPGTGTFECQKRDDDQVTVTITTTTR